MALAALILGILACVVPLVGLLLAPVAIVLGIIHLVRDRPEGKGKAIAGLACGCAAVVVQAVLAGMLLPAISMVREQAAVASSEARMRQVVVGCHAWSQEKHPSGSATPGAWPPDLDTLARDQKLPPALFTSPRAEGVPAPHYLYARPAPDPSSEVPVLLENPACRKGRAIIVCYGDGRSEVIKDRQRAQALWSQAQRLTLSPKGVLGEGFTAADWQAEPPAPQP